MLSLLVIPKYEKDQFMGYTDTKMSRNLYQYSFLYESVLNFGDILGYTTDSNLGVFSYVLFHALSFLI